MMDLSSISMCSSRYRCGKENVLETDVRMDEYSSGKSGVCNGVKGTGSERGNGQWNQSNRDQSESMLCQRMISNWLASETDLSKVQ